MRTSLFLSTAVICSMVSFGCSNKEKVQERTNQQTPTEKSVSLDGLNRAYFASGCFWCVEAIYESVRGVEEAVSGYAGGAEENPTYRQVSIGATGHTETVEVYYDPDQVSYETLVKVYYGSHDPTTVNGQHPDYGRQYRSAIFYLNDEEKKIAEDFKSALETSVEYDKPIATEIIPLERFWIAEEYHQDYEKRNPNQPYIRNVSIPRLRKFQEMFPELLKEEAKQDSH
ncbi:MAG: peptide-methionine (S)-S-oxide reductase MsrA [Chlorobi bacterium]|nr:peptide-methionine (S)-S-oxide reductase MsrA [Chlorobiota bacterium]